MSRDLLSGLKTAEIALPVKNDVCPRCGSDNLEPSFISSSLSLHLRRCRNCGHVFASEEETHSASTSLPVDVGQTKAEHNLAQGVANITADEEDLNEIPPELDEFFTSHNFAFERDNNGVVTYRKVPPGNDKIEFDLNSGEWIHSGGGFKLGNELFPGDGNGLQELQKYLDSYSKFNRLEGLEASKIAAKPPVYKEDESIPDDYCIRCGQCRRQHGGSKPVSCIDRTDNHDWHPMSEIDPNAPVGVISVTGSPIPPMISSEKEAAGFRKAILPAALLMGLGPGALAQQPSTPKEKAPIVQQDPQNKSKITIESLDGAPISDISEGEPLIPKKTKPVLPVDDPYLRYRTQQASKEAGIGDTARATTAGELAEFFRKFDTTAPVIIESAAPTSPPIVMSIYEYWNSAGKPKITIDTDPFYTYVKNMDQEQLKRQERRKNMQIENAPKTSAAIPSYQQILNPAGFVVDENAPQESGMEIVYWNSRFKDGPSTDKGSIEAVVVLSDNSWEAYGGGGANDVIGEGLNPADLQEWLRSQGKVASVKTSVLSPSEYPSDYGVPFYRVIVCMKCEKAFDSHAHMNEVCPYCKGKLIPVSMADRLFREQQESANKTATGVNSEVAQAGVALDGSMITMADTTAPGATPMKSMTSAKLSPVEIEMRDFIKLLTSILQNRSLSLYNRLDSVHTELESFMDEKLEDSEFIDFIKSEDEPEVTTPVKQGAEDGESETPPMGLEKYPEFQPLIDQLAREVLAKIEAEANKIQSKMPYKEQFVLEELIKFLKDFV